MSKKKEKSELSTQGLNQISNLLDLPKQVSMNLVLDDLQDLFGGKVSGKGIARLGMFVGGAYDYLEARKRENETGIEQNSRLKGEIAELEAMKENEILIKRKKELLEQLQGKQ